MSENHDTKNDPADLRRLIETARKYHQIKTNKMKIIVKNISSIRNKDEGARQGNVARLKRISEDLIAARRALWEANEDDSEFIVDGVLYLFIDQDYLISIELYDKEFSGDNTELLAKIREKN